VTIRRKTGIRVVLAAYALLLAAVSLLPPGSRGPGQWQQLVEPPVQKLLHVAAYAGLTVLIIAATRSGHISLGGLILIPLAAVAYGALLELAQAAVPGRFTTLRDVLLNGAGVLVGVFVVAGLRALRGRADPPPPGTRTRPAPKGSL
jgi:VanZ family protein